MSTRRAYAHDVTDAQWALLEPLLPLGPQPGQVGRPRAVDLRKIVNAILYVTWTGCQEGVDEIEEGVPAMRE